MVTLDALIVNVAVPSIQRDLGFAAADLTWIVNVYALMFGGFLLLGGRAADLFGRRRLFLAGLGLFTGASLLAGLAGSPATLLTARGLQGLGAALLAPAALSTLTTAFFHGPERARAMGAWAAASAVAGGAGLVLGGVLTDLLSWSWIFLVNVPVGVAGMVIARRELPAGPPRPPGSRFDLAGALTVTGGLSALVYALAEAHVHGWAAPRTVAGAGAAAVLLAGFVLVERGHPTPLVPLRVLRVRDLAVANLAMFTTIGCSLSIMFFGSIYLQDVLDWSPTDAGLAFAPSSAAVLAGAVLARRLIPRVGLPAVAMAGCLSAAAGAALLTRAGARSAYLVDVLPTVLLVWLGMGLMVVTLILLATKDLPAGQAGLASGLIATSQRLGGAVWLAALTPLLGSAVGAQAAPAGAVDGFHRVFWAAAALAVVGAALLATIKILDTRAGRV
jgi:EmrB/QacA subfamily drug resistance transporter